MAYSGDISLKVIEVERLTLHELELPGPATAHTQVVGMSSLHDIVKRLHSLLDLQHQQDIY